MQSSQTVKFIMEKRMFTLCNLSILPLIKTKCLCRKEVWQVTHEPEWTAFDKNSQLAQKIML